MPKNVEMTGIQSLHLRLSSTFWAVAVELLETGQIFESPRRPSPGEAEEAEVVAAGAEEEAVVVEVAGLPLKFSKSETTPAKLNKTAVANDMQARLLVLSTNLTDLVSLSTSLSRR